MNTNSAGDHPRGGKSAKWEGSVNRSLREALSRSPSPRGRDRSPHGRYSPSESRHGRDNSRRNDNRSYHRGGGGWREDYPRKRGLNEDRRHGFRDFRQSHPSENREYNHRHGRDSERYGNGESRKSLKRRRSRSRSRSRSPFRKDRHARHTRHDADYKTEDFESNRDSSQFKHSSAVARKDDPVVSSNVKPQGPAALSRSLPSGQALSVKEKFATGKTASVVEPAEAEPLMDVDVPEGPPEPTEDEIIEERRRRREAIKAKYRDASTDLRIQALEANAFTPKTPASDGETPSHSVATSPEASGISRDSSPHLLEVQAVNSDTELMNKQSLLGANNTNDEQSAADYDPTRDTMEVSARNHDEIKVDDREIEGTSAFLIRAQAKEKAKKVPKKEEMAAEFGDDYYDMFGDSPEMTRKPAENGPVKRKAKVLDVSLLDNWDDPEGYYKTNIHELLDGRYGVQKTLGKGVFASVIQAEDEKTSELVAIKMVRNQEAMTKAGAKEMRILQALAEADPEDKKHIVRLHRSFNHKGHLCMVFEHLDINLREVLKKFGRDVGIHLKAIRVYAQQMFLALAHLRKCEYIHADLKPDNMLVNEDRTRLKICDLGSATEAWSADVAPYLASRFYRAPEVMLGLKYSYAIDMWSIGCTLYELYTGKILFPGDSNNQMLRLIMECRGKINPKILRQGEFTLHHFEPDLDTFRSLEDDKTTGRKRTRLVTFASQSKDLRNKINAAAKSTVADSDPKELHSFADLLDRCLSLHPERRIQPLDALKHPFIERSNTSKPSKKA